MPTSSREDEELPPLFKDITPKLSNIKVLITSKRDSLFQPKSLTLYIPNCIGIFHIISLLYNDQRYLFLKENLTLRYLLYNNMKISYTIRKISITYKLIHNGI